MIPVLQTNKLKLLERKYELAKTTVDELEEEMEHGALQ
jgi:hypothetical protein